MVAATRTAAFARTGVFPTDEDELMVMSSEQPLSCPESSRGRSSQQAKLRQQQQQAVRSLCSDYDHDSSLNSADSAAEVVCAEHLLVGRAV